MDAAEARASPLFRNLFKLMDRDGDGKLFRKEVIAFLDEMEALQKVATARASQRRATRAGSVMRVCCHCQPPRLVQRNPCSIQVLTPYHCTWQASGARSVRINQGSW